MFICIPFHNFYSLSGVHVHLLTTENYVEGCIEMFVFINARKKPRVADVIHEGIWELDMILWN